MNKRLLKNKEKHQIIKDIEWLKSRSKDFNYSFLTPNCNQHSVIDINMRLELYSSSDQKRIRRIINCLVGYENIMEVSKI